MLLGATIAAMLSVCVSLQAAPPDNADPNLVQWFQNLLQPDTGVSCCSIADCHPVDSRVEPAGYEVLLDDEWRGRRFQGKHNPIGRAGVCSSQAMGILCFVRGTEI
jgi:hypothetical protein